MNNIVIKAMVGILSLGAVSGAGILTKNYIKHDGQLTNISKVAQSSSSLKNVNQEVKQAEKKLNEAKEDKEQAEAEVKVADKEISKAEDAKEEALKELANATTEEQKQAAEKKIAKAEKQITVAKQEKKQAEKKVEQTTKKVEQATKQVEQAKEQVKQVEKKVEQNASKKATSNANTETKNTSKSTQTTTSTKSSTNTQTTKPAESKKEDTSSGRTLTDEQLQKVLEAAKNGEKADKQAYRDAYFAKYGKYPEEKESTVEFHFYSTNRNLTIHCTKDYCGDSGHIWFVEVECDMNKCEGFTNSSGNKVSTLLMARRADITELNVTPPAAKYGYKFVGWELISSGKAVSNELGSGILSGKYIATYEKA